MAAVVEATPSIGQLDILQVVGKYLSGNKIACSAKLINKASAECFRRYKVVHLSHQVPEFAFREHWTTPGRIQSLTFTQRRQLVRLTAGSGSRANTELALRLAGIALSAACGAFHAAAAARHVETCSLLLPRGCALVDDALPAAAQEGHRAVCTWLLENGCHWSPEAVCNAAKGGHSALAHWLWQRRPEPHAGSESIFETTDVLTYLEGAAEGYDLAAFQRLFHDLGADRFPTLRQQQQQQPADEENAAERLLHEEEREEFLTEFEESLAQCMADVMTAAVVSPTPDWRAKAEWLEGLGWHCDVHIAYQIVGRVNDVNRLAWLQTRGHEMDKQAATFLTGRTRDVAVLQALVDMGLEIATTEACREAAEGGNLVALQFLVDRMGAHPDAECMKVAFINGNLDVLRYLHGRGVRLSPEAVRRAVTSRQAGFRKPRLEVMCWVVDTLDKQQVGAAGVLMEAAASEGSVELMTELRQRGCPWTEWTFRAAVWSGCEAAMEWLVENGCPPEAPLDVYAVAAVMGDLATLQCCLVRLGCLCDKEQLLMKCVESSLCSMQVLRLLSHEAGCRMRDWEGARRLAEKRLACSQRDEVLQWLEEERAAAEAAAEAVELSRQVELLQ